MIYFINIKVWVSKPSLEPTLPHIQFALRMLCGGGGVKPLSLKAHLSSPSRA